MLPPHNVTKQVLQHVHVIISSILSCGVALSMIPTQCQVAETLGGGRGAEAEPGRQQHRGCQPTSKHGCPQDQPHQGKEGEVISCPA